MYKLKSKQLTVDSRQKNDVPTLDSMLPTANCKLPTDSKGSILIVALWLLTIFVMLVLSLGYRSHLEAKIAARSKETLIAGTLFHSGVNLAKYYIMSDTNPSVDSMYDEWYNSISFSEDVWSSKNLTITIADCESKININTASSKQLRYLFEAIDAENTHFFSNPEDLAGDILAWRGGVSSKGLEVQNAEYKGGPFSSIFELMLLEEFDKRDFAVLEKYITIYGDGNTVLINPNTASMPVLNAVIMGLAGDEQRKKTLYAKIVDFREAHKPIENAHNDQEPAENEEKPYFTEGDLSPYNLLRRLDISSDVLSVSIALQFVKHCTLDSKIFDISLSVQPARNSFERNAFITLGPARVENAGIIQEKGYSIFAWHEPE